jgi:hypothetical protein
MLFIVVAQLNVFNDKKPLLLCGQRFLGWLWLGHEKARNKKIFSIYNYGIRTLNLEVMIKLTNFDTIN